MTKQPKEVRSVAHRKRAKLFWANRREAQANIVIAKINKLPLNPEGRVDVPTVARYVVANFKPRK